LIGGDSESVEVAIGLRAELLRAIPVKAAARNPVEVAFRE
jgi:hypothetical protein